MAVRLVNYLVAPDDPEAVGRVAAMAVERGYRAVKLHEVDVPPVAVTARQRHAGPVVQRHGDLDAGDRQPGPGRPAGVPVDRDAVLDRGEQGARRVDALGERPAGQRGGPARRVGVAQVPHGELVGPLAEVVDEVAAEHFFADLERAAAANFYRAVGEVGRIFIEIEAEGFAMEARRSA